MVGRPELLGGIALDLLIGDPRWLPHPVRGIGWLAKRLEAMWRRTGLPLRAAGLGFWTSVVFLTGLCVWAALRFLPAPWVQIYWIFALIAIRDLDLQAARVVKAVSSGDLAGARQQLSWIVGRDTADLSEAEILRAATETLAENLCDAVIAPLFYLAIGGPVAMAVYKAINTLDSMVGYRNDRYREFGWASARLDDLANFIPARLSALLIWFCAALPGYRWLESIRVTMRDGSSQPSPNSGYPEAACAGALGIRLGGMNFYRGVASRKQFLGNPIRALDASVFEQARILFYSASLLMVMTIWLVAL